MRIKKGRVGLKNSEILTVECKITDVLKVLQIVEKMHKANSSANSPGSINQIEVRNQLDALRELLISVDHKLADKRDEKQRYQAKCKDRIDNERKYNKKYHEDRAKIPPIPHDEFGRLNMKVHNMEEHKGEELTENEQARYKELLDIQQKFNDVRNEYENNQPKRLEKVIQRLEREEKLLVQDIEKILQKVLDVESKLPKIPLHPWMRAKPDTAKNEKIEITFSNGGKSLSKG